MEYADPTGITRGTVRVFRGEIAPRLLSQLGNIITPLLQRQIVRLPPALTLTVQLLLAVIAGPLGVALAAPITAAALGIFKVLLPADTISTAPTSSLAPEPVASPITLKHTQL